MKYRMQRLRLLLNKILMTIFNLHFYYTILQRILTLLYDFTCAFYIRFYYTILHVACEPTFLLYDFTCDF